MQRRTRAYNKWSDEEKQRLQELLALQRDCERVNWLEVAAQLQTKNARQCYDQHAAALKQPQKPDARHFWTEAEEQTLAAAFKQNPFQWQQLRDEHFPHLSVTQVKNKVNAMRYARMPARSQTRLGSRDSETLAAQLQKLLGLE